MTVDPAPGSAPLGDRYSIERELGRGGMATVYLAEDHKHRRKVAVKVLKPELSESLGSERFLREIETVARLTHPHILPLYDSGASGSTLFYVMPFVRGESLRQRLVREHRIEVGEALRIVRGVASALTYAHGEGLVHRDIKPENIMLHEGEALLADFGIALPLRGDPAARLTMMGMVVGTPIYMSPEQALGDATLDARSDIYSLACVLRELLTGDPPGVGAPARGTLARGMSAPAPATMALPAEVPRHVDAVLQRALAADPRQRFETVAEFVAALDRPAPSGEPVSAAGPPSVAVLPFRHLGSDVEGEYFADGITEDVIAQLSKVRALKVISHTSVRAFKERGPSLQDIGARLRARTIVDGSVRRAGERVRIVAQLIDVESDQHLWAETYDRHLTDIFAIQSDVAVQIATALNTELTRDERQRLGKAPTTDVEAYRLYLRGRQQHVRYTPAGLREAIAFFDQAIERDPRFAVAWAARGLVMSELSELGAMASEEMIAETRRSVLQALEIDPDLGEAHVVLAVLLFERDYDWDGAERAFQRAMDLTPGYADLWNLLGRMRASVGRFDEAIEAQLRAMALDPLAHRVDIATAYLRAGRLVEAEAAARRALAIDPNEARGHATLGWAFALGGRWDEGLAELRTAVRLSPDVVIWTAQLGQMLGLSGATTEARAILERLETRRSSEYVSPYHMAYVLTGLGEYDLALDQLEEAFETRAGAIYGVKGAFLFRWLRDNPRFKALLERMRVPG